MVDMSQPDRSDSEFDFSSLAHNWTLPLMVLDRQMRFVYANPAYLEATRKSWEMLEGVYMFDAFPDAPERQAPVEEKFRQTLAGEITYLDAQPYELTLPDGSISMRTWQCVQEPYRNAAGEVTHLVQRAEDITEQAELQRQNHIIQEELDHRIKNLFAVIIATVRISGPMAKDVRSFTQDFTNRLEAMSRVYSQLSENNWRGLPLRRLFRQELESVLGSDSDRYSLSGDDVTLSLKSTKDASLMIHELVVNALKYGCFSRPEGRLDITWSLRDGMLDISWVESGLSGVRPPEKEGFGTVLFQMMPNVTLTRDFRDEGMRLRLTVPVDISVD